MMMTTSDRDGEALNAIRLANRMLKEAGKTWETAFPVEESQEQKPELQAGELIPIHRLADAVRTIMFRCSNEWEYESLRPVLKRLERGLAPTATQRTIILQASVRGDTETRMIISLYFQYA
jgi:hypothetical protein